MIRRRIARLFLPAILLIGLAAALAWLLRTESGARWAWSQATAFVPGSPTALAVSGDLQSGLRFRGLAFENESTAVAAGSVQLQLALDLLPPGLSVESLTADGVTIRLLPKARKVSGRTPEEILETLELPFPIRFQSVRLGELLILDSQGATSFKGHSVILAGRWQKRLSISEGQLSSEGMQWQIAGSIDLQPPFGVEATVNNRLKPTTSGVNRPFAMNFEARFKGQVADLEAEVVFDRPAAALQGHIRNLLTAPDLELHLSALSLPWPLEGDTPQLTVQTLAAELSGSWHRYHLEARGTLELADLPPSSFEVTATGDLAGLQIEGLRLSGDLAQLKSSGAISWSHGLQLELSNAIERFDPRPWIATWPADHPLHGTLNLGSQDAGLWFRDVDLQAAGTAFRLSGGGTLDPGKDKLEATLGWKSFQWPLGSEHPIFRSEQGQLRLQGKPDDWTASGTVQIQAEEWPGGQLRINGQGNRESAKLVVDEGQVMGGRLKGQFDYRWTGSQPWSASFDAQDVDISALTGRYPGVISTSINASGQMDPQMLDLEIRDLHGVVRGLPVEAQGEIALAAGMILARDLQIRSGSSQLLLNGNMEDPDGLRFSGHIESLGAVFADATGKLTGAGRISSNSLNPRVELDLQGADLSWAGWRVASFSAHPNAEADDGTTTRILLTGVEHGERLLEELAVTLSGRRPLDNIEIEGLMDGTRLQARLDGSINHWDNLPELGWQGVIDSMRVSNEELGFLELVQPASFAVTTRAVQLDPACIRGPRDGRICLDFSRTEHGQSSGNTSLETISLDLVRLVLRSDLDFSQTLTGEMHWNKAAEGKASADVQLQLSPGQLVSADNQVTLLTGPGVFGFRIRDGELSAGNLDISLPGAGTIDTDFRAPDISAGIHSPIEGRLRVELGEIEPLTNWIPGLDRFTGSVDADVRLAGTLADPKLTGHASLVRGRIEHLASGLTISDFQLAGAVYEFDYTEFNGSFSAGDGQGRVKAAVDFASLIQPEITLAISGQNLTLINVPDVTLKANPDLRLGWLDHKLTVDGAIVIPQARISPRYLPTSIAAESADLVIVAGQQPDVEKDFIDRSKLRLNGSVSVELGEKVTVKLQRATARLKGKALFNWEDNLLPVADGTYLVSGKITAYGQLLEVSEGRVSYPHVPADNPHLDIAAEREIYGNVQVKRAGVQISGTLKNPVMETYTSPLTTEERALALLVTGHDFDYDQGVGAVEVGMYIAPKLYVSYGIGLFDSQSVISVRYDLKRGFGIKATGGQRASGADLSYIIER